MAYAVIFEKKGHIAYITMNRPEAMNSFNTEMRWALREAWERVRDDEEIWAAIVTGAGDRAFSSGMDLKEMAEFNAMRDRGEEDKIPPQTAVTPMRGIQVWKPFIAAINGYCLAGGLELALACDIRIAAENATFGLPEVTRGIIPGTGTQRLPRLIPFGRALEMMMTGERIDVQEALRLGLVSRVVPLPELMPAVEALANRINENGPLAVRFIQEAAYRGISLPLEEGLRFSNLLSEAIRHTQDAREGPLAFAQKRKPVYKGR